MNYVLIGMKVLDAEGAEDTDSYKRIAIINKLAERKRKQKLT